MNFITPFTKITLKDVGSVGGKNASLGQMIGSLSQKGIAVPNGFAITAAGYWHYLDANNCTEAVEAAITQIKDYTDMQNVTAASEKIRALIEAGSFPEDLAQEITQAYQALCKEYGQENLSVAVRSSATAEDLPTASFAGQQESFLNISGAQNLMHACKKCFSSLFTPRAIMYRHEKGFDDLKIALSIGVQKMIRSDLASSGVAFSLDTESGFKDAVIINSSYGLGEAIVQGIVTPDEFVVHKPLLKQGFLPLIKKVLGSKKVKIVYTSGANGQTTETVAVGDAEQYQFSLSEPEIFELARMVLTIEDLYSEIKGSWCPMDVEWAKDGTDGKLYIIQARPETIHSMESHASVTQYVLQPAEKLTTLATGQSIGKHIVTGAVRIINSMKEIGKIQQGDIIVTRMTDPDWVPAMKKAVGIITQQGGRTCHAAIVSRELNIAAIVGVEDILTAVRDGQHITLDCTQGSTGYVYAGAVPFTAIKTVLKDVPKAPVAVMINLADPDRAFTLSSLPVDGVGLARIEFIINTAIKIHPMALLHPELVIDPAIQNEIAELTASYTDKKQFFIDALAQGVATIAAAFWPRTVIVRFSDFKTNEYRNLIGGTYFEPEEENPMLGFRGAMRYYSKRYEKAFALECQALKKVREVMGFTNVKLMVPFVRTVQEGKKVLEVLAAHGLKSGQNDLTVLMMCEIPANVLLIDEFLADFDGISIGSNDLTQLTLGVDRDSPFVAGVFDERNDAVKKMFDLAVAGAKRNKKYSGICGQAPSDYPEIADYLISLGIESISLNPDSVVPFLMRFKK
jgi:pyruvate,water dikinase